MASRPIALLRYEIATTEERIREERRHLRSVLNTTRSVARSGTASRRSVFGAFGVAMVVGVVGALRSVLRRWWRSRREAAEAPRAWWRSQPARRSWWRR